MLNNSCELIGKVQGVPQYKIVPANEGKLEVVDVDAEESLAEVGVGLAVVVERL